jgi:NTE family protein
MPYLTRKLIFIILFLQAPLIAGQAGPATQGQKHKICLVLSGGGARGASHIGVLKVLEREHIPIDCVVGTSFGALAGGLYSIGYSPLEIENIFSSQDWGGIFSDAPQRHLMPILERRNVRYQLQLSFKGWNLELPSGLWEGQRLMESLDLLTTGPILDAQYDFDKLPVQFRAVATNLLDGKIFVFKQGRMSEALRASMAVPLVFTPVEKDGMLLADGGLVDNLPVDVARDLGADITIAVDTTSPLLGKDQIRNFLHVIDQAISLEMERNVEAHRKLASILIRPDLHEFTANDYSEIPKIIAQGEQEAEKRLGEIKNLVSGIPARTHGNTNSPPAGGPDPQRIIDSISFEGLKQIPPSHLMKAAHLRVHKGDILDLSALVGDLGRLYATRFFDSADYRLEPVAENRYRLVYLVKESSTRVLGLSVRYDNDYDFVALAEFTARQLFGSPSSATVSSQFGGLEDHFAALRLIPSPAPALFIEPKVEIRKQQRLEVLNKELFDTFTDRREGGRLTVGSTLFHVLEVEGNYHSERVKIQGGSGSESAVSPAVLAGLTFSLYRDSFDNPEFPRSGASVLISIEKQSTALGGDFDYSKWQGEFQRFFRVSDKSTFQVNASAGFTRGPVPFYDLFYTGGYSFSERASRQFLGLERDEIRSNQRIILGASYRRQIISNSLGFVKRGYLLGAYNKVWYSNLEAPPYQFRHFDGAGLGLALNTLFVPIRVMGGWGDGGRLHFYITIGPRF